MSDSCCLYCWKMECVCADYKIWLKEEGEDNASTLRRPSIDSAVTAYAEEDMYCYDEPPKFLLICGRTPENTVHEFRVDIEFEPSFTLTEITNIMEIEQ